MMESNTGGCSATEPEGSTSADPLLANGGGVVRQVQEIVLSKGDGCAPVDGTATGEAAHAGGGGDGGETDRHEKDERDDATSDSAGGPVAAPPARSASASASSDASATTATATPSRSPTLSPDVAPHPQHRPQSHETPPPPPPPPADDVDVDGEGEGLGPSDEDEDEDADASMRDVGTGGGESKGEGDRDPSGADGSDAPTDDRGGTPSVRQLKGWLVDFEREQQKHHGEGNHPVGATAASARPPAIRTSSSVRGDMCVVGPSGGSCSAPSSPARKMKRANGFGAAAGAAATPGRLLRKSTSLRVAAGEVQATDDGRAPVQTVSAWLTGGDPFREKRGSKGKNVKKLLSSSDGVPLVTKVDVTDRKKWLEGAFQKKGKEGGGGVGSREGSFDCGDSAASDGERVPAFAPASAENHPATSATPEKARGSVKEAARLFGGSVSDAPRSARVREMREAMEKRNEEVARSTDPRNFHRARWETPAGSTRPSAYKKKITDERGTAPKKCLADLP